MRCRYDAETRARAVRLYAEPGLIPGWQYSMSKHTGFVEAAIRQAAARRRREEHPLRGTVHHFDAGSQYTSVHFGQTLFLQS